MRSSSATTSSNGHDRAADLQQAVKSRKGATIFACPEEIAYRLGYISAADLEVIVTAIGDNPYSRYLRTMLDDKA